MAHLQYMPGDPRLVDQLVYELKSKGIFDQFRKDCIADVDTRPAYQNLRQRVESSVSTFLSRQSWQPDLNKNQLREKLRKHILDGNYLEQGVERIVDQVVNPKVASVFIPQVEDLVYNYLGITRQKTVSTAEASNEKVENLLPTDLEAVSPGSVKSNDGDNDKMDIDPPVTEEAKMDIDEQQLKVEPNEEVTAPEIVNQEIEKFEQVVELSGVVESDTDSKVDKSDIPLPTENIKVENIPPPEDKPPRPTLEKVDLPKISPEIPLPDSIIISADIPLPDENPKDVKHEYFKPINSDEDESSSDSSLRRNMSPLTPIRNFNNENSCDAQQAFENDLENSKNNEKKEPSTFRFAIEAKSPENSKEAIKIDKKEIEQINLSYQFNHQVNMNNFNTPLYEDSSDSNNLQIDYESDANSKANVELKTNEDRAFEHSKKDRKVEEKKTTHKSSHRSRDSSKYSSSKDKRSDSMPSSSRDSSRHDKKSSKDEHNKSKSSHKDKSSDKHDKKESDKKERDSSKHRSSQKSSSHKDSKSHKSSSSSTSQRRSSKHSDEKKSSSSNYKEKPDKSSERSSDKTSKDRSKDSKSSSHRSDKDRKSSSSKSSSKHDEKDKDKKSKKETDDHYSLSGRGNATRRSTDRDSNDGSSSSKGSHNPSSSKSSSSQKESKGNSSKSDNTSPSGESTSPSDKEHVLKETKESNKDIVQPKPIVRIDTHLELPMASPPRLPFVPDLTLRKPKIAANLEEAKKLMKMRRFLDEEQRRMNQEAALLLEFQANVRPSLSQVYSSIPGPELEFACVINNEQAPILQNNPTIGESSHCDESIMISNPTNALLAVVNAQKIEDITCIDSELSNLTESNDSDGFSDKSMNDTELPHAIEISKDELEPESEQSNVQTHDDTIEINDVAEACIPDVGDEFDEIKEIVLVNDTILIPDGDLDNTNQDLDIHPKNNKEKCEKENEKRTEYFEITVIAEELSESEESQNTIMEKFEKNNHINNFVSNVDDIDEPLDNNNTVIKETKNIEELHCLPEEQLLKYFTDDEKYDAELEKERFKRFLKIYTEKQTNKKIYLINCDSYEESVIKGVLEAIGTFDIVNYQRNGCLKLPKTTKSIVKNVNVASEVSLPFDNNEFEAAANELEMDLKVTRQTVLSPVKSECSFELSNDYDAKIDEMVNNASRQEIMEIILGNALSNESSSKMPKIDYVTECSIESDEVICLKRKLSDVETTVNNNRPVLAPRKLRKLSASDQITSTTEESEPSPILTLHNTTRSKYLGKARRVGLPRPRKIDQPNSPSSDKSVENYEQNTKITTVLPANPNGKMKNQPRNKIQRYDTSDLYKPKLHYLSRRNNIN